MKKQLFWMFGAALALTSCSNDEQVAVNPANEITFRTAVPMRTLASDIYSSSGKSLDQFTVNAWIVEDGIPTGTQHIQEETYKKNDEGTAYYIMGKDPHFWGVEDLSIIGEAYASDYNITFSSSDKVTYEYTVKVADDIAQQKDFITAPIYSLKNEAKDGIALTFKHQLAKIGIKAKNESEYAINIKEVRLGNVQVCQESSKLTVTLEESSASEKSAVWGDLTNGIYTVSGTWEVKESEISLLNVEDDQQFFMLVPQTITAWDPVQSKKDNKEINVESDGSEAATGAYIALLANIKHGDDFTVYPTGSDKEDGGEYGWVCVPVPTINWEANKQYNYLLTFSNEAVGCRKDGTAIMAGGGPLHFTASVSPWDGDSNDITPSMTE